MSNANEDQPESNQHDNPNQSATFNPMLYNFRITPQPGCNKTFALQQPFATLFDNLIAVLWAVYSKKSKIQIGVNQLQWALEFMKCMKVDYSYPESIGKIVSELEDQLISLYAKVGKKVYENKQKKEIEEMEREINEKSSKNSGIEKPTSEEKPSYNEDDIIEKLDKLNIPLDPATGEVKYLKDLNSLGKRNQKNEQCASDKKSSKTYMIGALQKILNKTTEADTKNGVQELIKELKVENPSTNK